jgi:tRNA(Arg) A34 adenosine deaminase TadA
LKLELKFTGKESLMADFATATALLNSRRRFLRAVSIAATSSMISEVPMLRAAARTNPSLQNQSASAVDQKRMRDLAAWTALTFETPNPVPFGAEIFHSETGESLMRAANAVGPEHDPSAHGELRTIRLACSKLGAYSLKGYTLYTTCEPCAMCMACALWAGLDRVVFGATIADAARFVAQIYVPAEEVAKRSDMKCVVDGPVEREACLALFNHPKMQETFKRWKAQRS